MEGLETVSSTAICIRILQVLIGSFIYIFLITRIVGQENKAKWFRRRSKYTFFNRRGIFGEYIHYGYPICWQGLAVFFIIYGVIFAFGYWYIFVCKY